MSTLKTTNIKNESSSSNSIVLDPTGGATANKLITTGITTISTAKVGAAVTITASGIEATGVGVTVASINEGQISGRRNLIINGAMNVAQRDTSVASLTSSGYRTCDRFKISISSLGTWTVTQESDAPSGFRNSLKVLATAADASPAAGDFIFINYGVEAQDLQCLSYGNSSAKPSTLSFWVKSNKTGNASVELQQDDNSDKQVSLQYNIASADTWEKKVIQIPGDASGVINDDTGRGIRIGWWMNSGSQYSGGSHRSSWTAEDNTDRNVSNLGVGGAVNDYLQITGVQWEIGNVATPFEHRSYGDELSLCQRYYEQLRCGSGNAMWSWAGSSASTGFRYRVRKRAEPTVTTWGTLTDSPSGGTSGTIGVYSPQGWRAWNTLAWQEGTVDGVRSTVSMSESWSGGAGTSVGIYFYGDSGCKADCDF